MQKRVVGKCGNRRKSKGRGSFKSIRSKFGRDYNNANCRCLVEYDNGSGIYQNAHTKKKYSTSKVDIENIKKAESTAGMSEVRKEILKRNIKSYKVKMYEKQSSTEEIIKNISGGDETEGSCASLAYAYAGNKAGYTVNDFRGGESQDFFQVIKR